jgi:SAM-dependent methyltransferase
MEYQCNICGSANRCEPADLGRETPDCRGCGSTLRMRAVVGLLSQALFGDFRAIGDFPERRDLRGVGLSDWDEYARRLADRLDYTNTYYHQEPRLDITAIPDDRAGSCDFLISTDVFEHVLPPVSAAFSGAKRLLKPGGALILTVPYSLEGEDTVEHFPGLHDWSLSQEADGAWRLDNRRDDGGEDTFRNLVFHGGPGSTLEMRVFSRRSLLRELEQAGFREVRIVDDAMPEIGVVWPCTWSLPVIARA